MSKVFFVLGKVMILIIFSACKTDGFKTEFKESKKYEDTLIIVNNNLIFYEIGNEILLEQIENFIDSIYIFRKELLKEEGFESNTKDSINFHRTINNRILQVIVRYFEDFTFYSVFYAPSSSGILNSPTFFSKINDNIIAFSFTNSRFDWNSDVGIKLPENIAWQYIKDYYPKEYETYLWNKEFSEETGIKKIVAPPTGFVVVMELIFRDSKLINKEIFFN